VLAVLVAVVARSASSRSGIWVWPSDLACDQPTVEVFDEQDRLGDVVAPTAGERDRERDAAGVDEQVML
jgi:hypothetical protein